VNVLAFDTKMNREKQNEYQREYRKRKRRERGLQKQGRKPNSDVEKLEAKQKRKDWEKEWRKHYSEYSPEKRLLWAARARAKKKNVFFDIEEKDILIPTHCPYLGIPLRMGSRLGEDRSDVCSLDRIIPSKGYTRDNIEVISQLANTMKNSASPEQLIFFAKSVLSKYT